MIDYIIVGLGLAGISFCEQLEENGKTFVVFDNNSQRSTGVAGGLYNPVILKRFTKVWKAEEQLELLAPFYKKIEAKCKDRFDYKVPVYRRLVSVEEQNLWFEKADTPSLNALMADRIHKNELSDINAAFGYGEIMQTGRIATDSLQKAYAEHLKKSNRLITEAFEHDKVKEDSNQIGYKGFKAKHIVFAEGFGLKQNPYFNYLPLNGTKGELLIIKAPDLKLDFVLKSSVFIIPLGNDHYRIGATYEWNDKTNETTEKGKEELLEKLKSFLKCGFEIISQQAGIRPTVTDRRPLVGKHPVYNNLYLLNGMGSRGVMIAPYIAPQLFKYIEHNTPLDLEIDIKRFENKYFSR